MVQDTRAYNKIRKARTSLVLKHPFFASLALRLKVVEDYSCQTAWTDGTQFGYNPHYVNILSDKKLEGMAAHIVMHPACNHHKRRNGRNKKTWNEACDYVINGILLDAGFTLPDGFLYREEYCERSAEHVYDILDGLEENTQIDDAENPEELEQEEQENQETAEEPDRDGSEQGENENPEESDSENGDPGKAGEVRDGQGSFGTAEGGKEETDWDDAVIQAAINAKGIGQLPSALERMLERHIEPELDWKELLARFVARNARSDYSWITPNKRYIHQNLYLPSLRNCELDHVVIAVDTSGSISDEELGQFAAELSEIFKQYPADLHILYCDNRLQRVDHLSPGDLPVEIEAKGGGGTDYRPVFSYVEEKDISPSCLIYLTDLECRSYPQIEPHYPVLWVKSGDSTIRPPFGEIINL